MVMSKFQSSACEMLGFFCVHQQKHYNNINHVIQVQASVLTFLSHLRAFRAGESRFQHTNAMKFRG